MCGSFFLFLDTWSSSDIKSVTITGRVFILLRGFMLSFIYPTDVYAILGKILFKVIENVLLMYPEKWWTKMEYSCPIFNMHIGFLLGWCLVLWWRHARSIHIKSASLSLHTFSIELVGPVVLISFIHHWCHGSPVTIDLPTEATIIRNNKEIHPCCFGLLF